MTISIGEKIEDFMLRAQKEGKLKVVNKPAAREYARASGAKQLPRKYVALIICIPGNPNSEDDKQRPRTEVLFFVAGSWHIAG